MNVKELNLWLHYIFIWKSYILLRSLISLSFFSWNSGNLRFILAQSFIDGKNLLKYNLFPTLFDILILHGKFSLIKSLLAFYFLLILISIKVDCPGYNYTLLHSLFWIIKCWLFEGNVFYISLSNSYINKLFVLWYKFEIILLNFFFI